MARLCCLLSLVLVVFALGGCGGSGSSGFDAKLAEEQAIASALDTKRCVSPQGSPALVCPLSEGEVRPDTVTSPVLLAPNGLSLVCDPGSTTCGLHVTLEVPQPSGSETLVVAIRSGSGANPWRIVGPPRSVSGMPMLRFAVDVPVEELDRAGPGEGVAQVAVLVFAHPVGTLPTMVERLTATGAQFVLVAPPTRASGGWVAPLA